MKALSIRQPWAWAILHAGKRIENRDWAGCAFRGPLLIHASKTFKRAEHVAAAKFIVEVCGQSLVEYQAAWDLSDRGGIVGVCEVVGTIERGGILSPGIGPAPDLRWWEGGFGLVLANVRPLPFTPFKGALGFFDVPEEIAGPLLVEVP